MKKALLLLLMLAGGCTKYTQAESDLVTEARKGIKLISGAQAIEKSENDAAATERRTRLAQAFDDDVRERKALDADWVIAHRQAYEAALNALLSQQQKDQQLFQTTQRNLSETDALLEKLEWMITIQGNFFNDVKSSVANTTEAK